MKAPTLDPQEEQARTVLGMLMGMLQVTDQVIAERSGLSRQSVQQRRKGLTRMRMGDTAKIAKALGISPRVFELSIPDAARYMADNHADLLIRSSRWFSSTCAA